MRASLILTSARPGRDVLPRTLAACAVRDCELIVGAPRSDADSLGDLRVEFPHARVVRCDGPPGLAPPRDRLAREARGEVLVFLEAPCKPEPGALDRLVRGVEATAGAAVLTPRLLALDVPRWQGDWDAPGHGVFLDLETLDHGWLPLGAMARCGEFHASPAPARGVVALGRPLYDRLGGFDPHLRVPGSECLDLGLKAWLAGHAVLHDPLATAAVRFRFDPGMGAGGLRREDLLADQVRIAWKNLGDECRGEWLRRCRRRHPDPAWGRAQALFEATRGEAERERALLAPQRRRDERWFAAQFGLDWPA